MVGAEDLRCIQFGEQTAVKRGCLPIPAGWVFEMLEPASGVQSRTALPAGLALLQPAPCNFNVPGLNH